MLKEILSAISIHLIFFWSIYFSDNIIYSGKDILRIHYASKIFLFESFQNSYFPVWTDKMFGGYPIFFDLERGYQNVFNLISVYFLGPINSLNFIFVCVYLIGFVSMTFLLQKLTKLNLWNSVILTVLYFFSHFSLFHVQHQNMVFSIYLLPALILLSYLFVHTRRFLYIILTILAYYFLVTFGSLQSVVINALFQSIFIIVFSKNVKNGFVNILSLVTPSFVLTIPSIYYFFQMFLDSERSISNVSGQGNLNFFHIGSYLLPFFLGSQNYFGTTLNADLLKQESLIYFSLSALLISILYFFRKDTSSNPFKRLLGITFLLFIILNVWVYFPFDLFRYWIRSSYIINFAILLLLADFLHKFSIDKVQNKLNNYNVKYILFFGFCLFLAISINFINKDYRFLFNFYLNDYIFYIPIYMLIAIITLIAFFKFPSHLILVLLVDFSVSYTVHSFNLTFQKSELLILAQQFNLYENTYDDNSLLKKGPSLSGYSGLVPKYESGNTSWREKYNLDNFFFFYLGSVFLTLIYLYGIKRYAWKNN